MTRSRLIAAAAGFGFAALATVAGSARADLLDEDDSVKPTAPQPAEPATPGAPQKPGAKPMTPAVKPTPQKPVPKIDDDEPTLKAPTPHSKDASTNGSTTVIPPKKPGAPAKAGAKRENEPVHFDSKGLKGLRNKGKVELTQDVVVTQGDMRVEADHAEVYFDEGAKDKKERGLLKVVAEGNPVKITGVDENSGEKFRAFGNSAVFLAKERTVVLEGNARLHRGDDSVIRSKKITYEMNSGWIKADRVAGELQPQAAGVTPTPGATPAPAASPAPAPAPKAAPATPTGEPK